VVGFLVEVVFCGYFLEMFWWFSLFVVGCFVYCFCGVDVDVDFDEIDECVGFYWLFYVYCYCFVEVFDCDFFVEELDVFV